MQVIEAENNSLNFSASFTYVAYVAYYPYHTYRIACTQFLHNVPFPISDKDLLFCYSAVDRFGSAQLSRKANGNFLKTN